MNWLEKELAFLTWLYKYKNFLGSLKENEFKEFKTKQEAIKQYMKEKGLKVHHLPYRHQLTLDQLEEK